MPHRTPSLRSRALGFSLVEIMVAAVIGLIGSVVIFQVFAVSESQKRTTTGGGDAQQAGLLALYSIERDARMAGYGINYAPLLGRQVLASDDGPPARDPILPANSEFKMVAIEITDGVGGAPDGLRFVYGNSDLSVAPVRLNSASASASTVHKVAIRFGFLPGDLVLACDTSTASKCSIQQVTDVPDTPAEEVHHVSAATYTPPSGGSATARYNKAGGNGVDYPGWSNTNQSGGVVYNLGQAPGVIDYSIATTTGQLMHRNLLTTSTASAIMDGIVQLQAQYGRDTSGTADGTVDVWDTTQPADFDGWSRVLALRIAIVARSSQFDKTYCSPNPQWTQGNGTATNFLMTNIDGSADSYTGAAACTPNALPVLNANPNNWRNYRFRVFETAIPVRNAIWYPIT
ncbi:MAG: hypothetical protein A3I02_11150 [Betaproteobacteria bacterium RIFCSPLOWO2_02_FULL_67_26]|nr:MAG: hypothetical protein A3I02_11150 [Betaproteobacteria bacterium RIFCSPLOWO2_02_FULL_67_26]